MIAKRPLTRLATRRGPSNEIVVDDPERDRLALIYRSRLEFAVGHGVSVHAGMTLQDPTKAHRIQTEIIPRYEVAVTETPGLDPRDRQPCGAWLTKAGSTASRGHDGFTRERQVHGI
jgi:hypothetical protein